MKSLVLLLSITIIALQCLVSTSRVCHVDDETSLLSFKSHITHDPSGMLASWMSGTDCCTWEGITCLHNDRVTALGLFSQSDTPTRFLSGTISPSLAKLKDLDGFYLVNMRNITGKFPTSLYGLPKLRYVYLENNRLSGPLPDDIGRLGTRLDVLSLEGNRFTGSIPGSVSELTGLTRINLAGNLITGNIPIGIRRLEALIQLELQNNQLSKPIPEIFSSLNQLRYLNLSRNQFAGKIPNSISSLSPKLAYLELAHNSLTGQIPSFLAEFQYLSTLDLSWNNFTGTLPKSFKKLAGISNLDLSHNSLVDPFPAMNAKRIRSLDLSYNNLHLGKIPDWVTSSPNVYSLKLAKCGIEINLTNWNPKEAYFYEQIDLSENRISGSPIPLLDRAENLVGFWASGNQLSFDLGKTRIAHAMYDLDLSRNSVFGRVPSSVSELRSLNLSRNRLCGRIPATDFPASSFVGNDCLCGSPLPAC